MSCRPYVAILTTVFGLVKALLSDTPPFTLINDCPLEGAGVWRVIADKINPMDR